MQHLWGR